MTQMVSSLKKGVLPPPAACRNMYQVILVSIKQLGGGTTKMVRKFVQGAFTIFANKNIPFGLGGYWDL
jgi:hypothetical protein